MSSNEKQLKLEKIFSYLSSDNEQAKVSSLRSYRDLAESKSIPEKYQEQMFDFVKNQLSQPHSPLHSDLWELLTIFDFSNKTKLDDLLPILEDELAKKNRFTLKHIMKILSEIGNRPQTEVQRIIEKVLTKSEEIFDKDYLLPFLIDFIKTITEKNNQFLLNNEKLIDDLIKARPEGLDEVVSLLENKKKAFEKFIREEEERRERERVSREIEKKNAEEERRKRKERLFKIKKGLEKTSEVPEEHKSSLEEGKSQILQENSKNQIVKEDNNRDQNELDNNQFVSFSSLGLKRKKED